MAMAKRIQETYKGRGQATLTQSRNVPNAFIVEYQNRGLVWRTVVYADWQARAFARRMVFGRLSR